jgi:predicted DsbA family dithiol-disulfide isomerase
MKPKIKVDIISDVVCPWCYIGKKRFEKAVEALKDDFDFEIDYKAFELHPEITDFSTNLKDYLISKYGDSDRVQSMTDQVIGAAAEEGIIMEFKEDKIVPNTLLAHKLLKLIPDTILKARVNEALLKAYFTDNVNIGLQKNVFEIGKTVGVSLDVLKDFMTNTDVSEVQAEENFYRKSGVTAVPSFIINDKHLVQGAQNTESFINAFQQIGNPTPPDNSCAPGSGCC